jgi:hypothetical protein
MTFSKLNYAIASLLLVGASSLLVSCASEPEKANEELAIEIPPCPSLDEEEATVIRKTSEEKSKRTEKVPTADDYADCITVSSNGS